MKRNRKRLNNKGFTLVELLAVVVILALVMGIAASSMLNTMNSSRQSTLHSAAQTAATNLNNWVIEEQLINNDADRMIGNDFIVYTQQTNKDKWVCLNSDVKVTNIPNKNNQTTLLKALGLNENDIVISTKKPTIASGTYTITSNNETLADNNCSALRYNSSIGGYEFLLVAKRGGKYYVASSTNNFAFSRATGPNASIAD